jgi:hypothetical protein
MDEGAGRPPFAWEATARSFFDQPGVRLLAGRTAAGRRPATITKPRAQIRGNAGKAFSPASLPGTRV